MPRITITVIVLALENGILCAAKPYNKSVTYQRIGDASFRSTSASSHVELSTTLPKYAYGVEGEICREQVNRLRARGSHGAKGAVMIR